MKNIRRISLTLAALLCTAGMFAVPTDTQAAENVLPSLFCNDEEWYKDTVSPLILRDGVYYIPADLCSMFDYISVTYPGSNNLLIHNTVTGEYISVLFREQSAALNGEIHDNVGVFRDDGVYYVDAALVCDAVGLGYDYYTSENGNVSLRVTDENRIFTFDDLISTYFSAPEDIYIDDGNGKEDVVKRIYLLCSSPDGHNLMFPARDNLEYYGLEYTLFLDISSSETTILSAIADGEYGITADSAAGLDALSEKLFPYSRRNSRLTLSTGDADADLALRDAGYCPIRPDFTVNGATYADGMLTEIIDHLGKYESCTVYLEDCWSSQRMIVLISEINYKNYVTSNLTDMN